MPSVLRRLLLLDHPNETRFFLFIGGFGLVLGAIYWFLTYEVAGTVMLAGFGIGSGLLGVGLLRSRPRAMTLAARRGRGSRSSAAAAGHDVAGAGAVRSGDAVGPGDRVDDGPARGDESGAPGGFPTPFDEPTGRLPGETLAPLALGLGTALAVTAVVFGPWLFVAGLLPLVWGAWTWLAGARDELDATVEDERRAEPSARVPVTKARDATDSGVRPAEAHPAPPEP